MATRQASRSKLAAAERDDASKYVAERRHIVAQCRDQYDDRISQCRGGRSFSWERSYLLSQSRTQINCSTRAINLSSAAKDARPLSTTTSSLRSRQPAVERLRRYTETRRGPLASDHPGEDLRRQSQRCRDSWSAPMPSAQTRCCSPAKLCRRSRRTGSTASPVQKRAFCQTCNFLKWGAWGTRVTSNDHTVSQQPRTSSSAGGLPAMSSRKTTCPTTGSANYAGDAIGTVSTNGQQYVATGDLDMSWNFGTRSGRLDNYYFDNKNFAGLMLAPGKAPASFGGPLVGNGVFGAANGSFVGSTGRGSIPRVSSAISVSAITIRPPVFSAVSNSDPRLGRSLVPNLR